MTIGCEKIEKIEKIDEIEKIETIERIEELLKYVVDVALLIAFLYNYLA